MMMIPLGELTIFVLGFHLSPLRHGTIDPTDQLQITVEDGNKHDRNAVQIFDGTGVDIGHIAVEQSHGFRSVLRESRALAIDVEANFVRTEDETVIKANGSRYQGRRVVLSVTYSLRSHLDSYSQKLSGIKKAVEESGFLFTENKQSLPPVAGSENQVSDGNCKRLADDYTVLQAIIPKSRER